MAGEKVKPPVLVKPVVRKPLTKTQMLVSPARLVIPSARRPLAMSVFVFVES